MQAVLTSWSVLVCFQGLTSQVKEATSGGKSNCKTRSRSLKANTINGIFCYWQRIVLEISWGAHQNTCHARCCNQVTSPSYFHTAPNYRREFSEKGVVTTSPILNTFIQVRFLLNWFHLQLKLIVLSVVSKILFNNNKKNMLVHGCVRGFFIAYTYLKSFTKRLLGCLWPLGIQVHVWDGETNLDSTRTIMVTSFL